MPRLFPKKTGKSLALASDNVRLCYARSFELGAWPSTFKLLHITAHAFPLDGLSPLRYSVMAILAGIWRFALLRGSQALSAAVAFAYSIIESAFTFGERGRPYKSLAQFVATLLYTPVLLDVYGGIFLRRRAIYALLFPINVWVLDDRRIFDHGFLWRDQYRLVRHASSVCTCKLHTLCCPPLPSFGRF